MSRSLVASRDDQSIHPLPLPMRTGVFGLESSRIAKLARRFLRAETNEAILERDGLARLLVSSRDDHPYHHASIHSLCHRSARTTIWPTSRSRPTHQRGGSLYPPRSSGCSASAGRRFLVLCFFRLIVVVRYPYSPRASRPFLEPLLLRWARCSRDA